MIHLTIDGNAVQVPGGATVLDAARMAGVEIPTLCHLERFPPYTSCMICVVRDNASQRLIPACSARVVEGMAIDTTCEAVRAARRSVLDLLLSEHVGDCEAPCRLGCPAYMDIPAMIRRIGAGDPRGAYAVIMQHIPLPATLGRVCPAPCEKVCRRGQSDEPVAIRMLKRFAADHVHAEASPWRPECAAATGHRVAIVGAGPAGLAAAYFLRRAGLACTVIDAAGQAGGMLRSALDESILPRQALDADIAAIDALGLDWRWHTGLGREVRIEALRRDYDAVVLAFGAQSVRRLEAMGLPTDGKGLAVDRHTLAVELEGVFAAGACVHATRMAVRAVADGNLAASSVCAWLADRRAGGIDRRFNSRAGVLSDVELRECLKEADARGRGTVEGEAGFSPEAARAETTRCLHCDCRDKAGCRLRALAEAYDARQRRYPIDERPLLTKCIVENRMVLEQGKCIKCGRCVRICEAAGVPSGFTFLGRGLDVRVDAPVGADWSHVPDQVLRECIQACPTGAVAEHNRVDLA